MNRLQSDTRTGEGYGESGGLRGICWTQFRIRENPKALECSRKAVCTHHSRRVRCAEFTPEED